MTGDEPATNRQKQWIADLGVPGEAIPEDMNRAEASAWIDELKEYDATSRRGTIPEGRIRTDLFSKPPSPRGGPAPVPTVTHQVGGPVPAGTTVTTSSSVGDGKVTTSTTPVAGSGPVPAPQFRTAAEMQAGGSAIAPYEERDEGDRGPLTPVQVMTQQEREQYGLAETQTVVLRGREDKTGIVPEYGMPAKYLFARLSINRRTNRADIRVFASIEGLVFRANAFSGGIKKLAFDYIEPSQIPGLAVFLKETDDPEIVARAHVTLGDGSEITEEGTVRLSEITLHKSARTGRMVARSPVARDYPLEVAKKRALARALRWGTGFGGTALDELPPAETAEPRQRAGLPAEPAAALPAPEPAARPATKKGAAT